MWHFRRWLLILWLFSLITFCSQTSLYLIWLVMFIHTGHGCAVQYELHVTYRRQRWKVVVKFTSCFDHVGLHPTAPLPFRVFNLPLRSTWLSCWETPGSGWSSSLRRWRSCLRGLWRLRGITRWGHRQQFNYHTFDLTAHLVKCTYSIKHVFLPCSSWGWPLLDRGWGTRRWGRDTSRHTNARIWFDSWKEQDYRYGRTLVRTKTKSDVYWSQQ